MKKLYIPPFLIMYSLLTMLWLHYFTPQFNYIVFPYNLAGLLIALAGFMLMGQVRGLFRKHETTLKIEKSNHLINEGIFAKTRNPMYLGMAILILGFAVISSNLLALSLPFLFLLLVRIVFIPQEERLMVEAFGEEYKTYKTQVRRWV